jgi:hypothetical protein
LKTRNGTLKGGDHGHSDQRSITQRECGLSRCQTGERTRLKSESKGLEALYIHEKVANWYNGSSVIEPFYRVAIAQNMGPY